MPGDIQIRLPGDLNLPTQWYGLFTTADLVRIGIPAVVAFFAVFPPTAWLDLALLLAGISLGVTLAKFRIGEYTVDQYLWRAVDWYTEPSTVKSGPVRTRHHRVIETRDAQMIGVLRVQPVNIALQSQIEQRALHEVWQAVIDTVDYPVEVQSRQRRLDLSEYISQLQEVEPATPSAAAARVRQAYTAYAEFLNRGQLVVTEHYVVVRVKGSATDAVTSRLDGFRKWVPILGSERPDSDSDIATTAENRLAELDQRCTELHQVLTRGELSATRLTGPPLQEFIDTYYTPTVECTSTTVTASRNTTEEHRRHLLITGVPSSLPFAWLESILTVDGLVDITQLIGPRDTTDVVSDLRRRLNQLTAEIDAQNAAGHAGTNEYEARAADADWMLDLLADRDATACDYGLLITVHHPDPETCTQTLDQVKTRLTTLQLDFEIPRFQTPQMHRAWSPFHAIRLPTMLQPSPSAAAGFPAATNDALNTRGVVYGENGDDGTPVILDRFQWSSHSVVRMGMVGSGKSYAAKLELLRAWLTYPNLQIYVVDPKQEYLGLIDTLGGTTYTVASPEDAYRFDDDLVAVQLAERGDAANPAVLRRIVQDLYTATSQDDHPTLAVIDEARILLNDEHGRDVLNQFVLEGRDTNTAITLITQNASHFTQHRQGREILDNVPGKVFMRHDRVPESVIEYFQLSERERQALYNLQTGTESVCSEALLKVPEQGVDTRLTIRATAPEHAVITQAEQVDRGAEGDWNDAGSPLGDDRSQFERGGG